jgi:hypothetical protein
MERRRGQHAIERRRRPPQVGVQQHGPQPPRDHQRRRGRQIAAAERRGRERNADEDRGVDRMDQPRAGPGQRPPRVMVQPMKAPQHRHPMHGAVRAVVAQLEQQPGRTPRRAVDAATTPREHHAERRVDAHQPARQRHRARARPARVPRPHRLQRGEADQRERDEQRPGHHEAGHAPLVPRPTGVDRIPPPMHPRALRCNSSRSHQEPSSLRLARGAPRRRAAINTTRSGHYLVVVRAERGDLLEQPRGAGAARCQAQRDGEHGERQPASAPRPGRGGIDGGTSGMTGHAGPTTRSGARFQGSKNP